MADLIPMPNFAAQISQSAQLPSNIAGNWANADYTQTQATGQDLQNQQLAARLPYYKAMVQHLQQKAQAKWAGQAQPQTDPAGGQGAGAQDAPQLLDPSDSDHQGQYGSYLVKGQPEALAAQFASKLAPVPVKMNAQEQSDYEDAKGAESLGVITGAQAEAVKTNAEAAKENQNASNQRTAVQGYNLAKDIGNFKSTGDEATDKKAMINMLQNDPSGIGQKELKMLPPGATSAQIRQLAHDTAGNIYQFTGRTPLTDSAGYAVDPTDKSRVFGQDYVAGLSKEQSTNFIKDMGRLEDYTVGDRVLQRPHYKNIGYDTLNAALEDTKNKADWLNKQGQPNVSGVETSPPPTRGGAVRTAAGERAPTISSNSSLVIPSTASPDGKVDLNSAPDFPRTADPGQGSSTHFTVARANELAAKQDDYNSEARQSVTSAQMNIARDQAILKNLDHTAFGPGTATAAAFQTAAQNMGWHPEFADIMMNNDNFYFTRKMLGTEGITNFTAEMKEAGANSARVGAAWSKLAQNELSANTDISRGATREMLQWDLANHQYNLDKNGKAYQAAMTPNPTSGAPLKDPSQFGNWYEQHYPRQEVVPRLIGQLDHNGDLRPTSGKQGSDKTNPVLVTNPDSAKALQKGTWFKDPSGRVMQRGG